MVKKSGELLEVQLSFVTTLSLSFIFLGLTLLLDMVFDVFNLMGVSAIQSLIYKFIMLTIMFLIGLYLMKVKKLKIFR